MAFAGIFATPLSSGGVPERDSSAPSGQSGTRRSSRKAKPTRSFFDLQASTLWSQKRRAPTALETDTTGSQPAQKICVQENGAEAKKDNCIRDRQRERVATEEPQKQQEDSNTVKEPPAPDSENQKLREQQLWLIEGIKADAIDAFTKIVNDRRLFPKIDNPATKSATQPSESAAELAQRLELMSRQHAVEMAKLRMMQQLQLVEMQHNHAVAMCEHRIALDLEKQAALKETMRDREADLARRIDAIKARQWCATCGREAFFYCCWNTAYCDGSCQQRHWPSHMAVCAQRNQQTARR